MGQNFNNNSTGYQFICDIIEKNWFGGNAPGEGDKWTFNEDIGALSNQEFKSLISLFLQSVELPVRDEVLDDISQTLKSGQSYVFKEVRFELNCEDLVRFMACITFSEHRLGDITLLPPEIRFREFNAICLAIGLPEVLVRKIDHSWQSNLRQMVFNNFQ